MSIRVGVIGTGAMGSYHYKCLKKVVGAEVTAVSDVFEEGARTLIANDKNVSYFADGMELIRSESVDAVLIASADPTHEDYCLEAIRLGKPVFCEKPLAQTAAGARKVVDAEMKAGKKLVQLGFNRRFDPAYQEMKKALTSGSFGSPLVAHCAHRNPGVGENYIDMTAITGTAVHEIDTMSWLMGDYFVKAQVILPRTTVNSHEKLHDPQIVLLTTSTGMMVIVEVFVNCGYGYDIQCEVVAENGTVRLPDPAKPFIRQKEMGAYEITSDGLGHFKDAYEAELQAWADACISGTHSNGADAWDGYSAAIVCDVCLKAQGSGAIEEIGLVERPEFYR